MIEGFEFKIPYTIPAQIAIDLIYQSINFDSLYWIDKSEIFFGEGYEYKDFLVDGKYYEKGLYSVAQLAPFSPGCGIKVWCEDAREDKDTPFVLDKESMRRGFQVIVDKYPHHLSNIVNDNCDGITSDVFLQCCLFGEIVFS